MPPAKKITHGVRKIANGVWYCFVALIVLGSAAAAYWHAALGEPMTFRGRKINPPTFSPGIEPRELEGGGINYEAGNAEALPPKMKTPAVEKSTRESLGTEIFPAAAAPAKQRPRAAVVPERVLIAVPFSPQTPLGNRSQPFKDGCEEASVMMAVYWARGEKLDPETAKREILNQAAFEEYHFGYHRDTSLRETVKIFTDYYRYSNVESIYDIGIEDIRREIAGGNIVIVPAAGELLKNPYFRDPPPRYHMLVIRGYDDTAEQFITNDPGTDYGENFRYSYELLYQAIHDWVGPDADITSGPKGMIVVHPPTSDDSSAIP